MAATLDARLRLNSSEFSGGLSRAVRESHTATQRMSQQFGTLKNVLMGGAVGGFIANFAKGAIEAAVNMERLEAAMSASAGSAALGRRRMEQIKKLSGEIGLSTDDATKAMLQFQSASMSAAESMAAIRATYNVALSGGGGAAELHRAVAQLQQIATGSNVVEQDVKALRGALPQVGMLMQQAFGSSRAEDIQALGISGREFVDTLIAMMAKLPEIGDTFEKQFARSKASMDEMKAQFGKSLAPMKTFFSSLVIGAIQGVEVISEDVANLFARLQGIDPEMMRRTDAAINERLADMDSVKEAMAKETREGEEAAKKAAENQKAIQRIIEKHQPVLRRAAEEARKFADELRFEGGLRAWIDQEAENAIRENLKKVQELNAEATRLRKEQMDLARGALDAANMAGVSQLLDAQSQAWRDAVDAQGATRAERKAGRAADRREGINRQRAFSDEVRKRLRKEENEARSRSFDDIKKGQFWNKEEAAKRIRSNTKQEMEAALNKTNATLSDIHDALNHLARA